MDKETIRIGREISVTMIFLFIIFTQLSVILSILGQYTNRLTLTVSILGIIISIALYTYFAHKSILYMSIKAESRDEGA